MEPFSEKHLSEKYVGWFNNPVVCQFNRHGKGDYSIEKARQYLAEVKKSENTIVFAIWRRGVEEHLGNISINDIDWDHRSGEISILIGERQHWGKGFGHEAVDLAVKYGFNELKLQRLWVEMTMTNVGMINIAKNLGFNEVENLNRYLEKVLGVPVRLVKYELRSPKADKGE